MFLSTIFHLENLLPEELVQTLELIITFVSLYGIIFYLLMTSEKNKKYFQRQK